MAKNRTDWMMNDRFGMFIHWGIYSIPAQGEWYRSDKEVADEEYRKYMYGFDPTRFDAREWARLAKRAGMRYAVLTAKHHDGFCLFDSKYTDFKITNTPYGKDIVREFLEAFRSEGIKVGLYYSLLDWDHPDFPHYGDENHPMRNNLQYKDYKYNFDNYITYMHNQVEELCTGYGKLDMIWFDFSYPGMEGEKWGATKLVRMVKKYQPDALMDTRLGTGGDSFGTLVTEHPTEYAGDFASCEQILPPEQIRNYKGDPVPWEACITLNNHWGYHRYDHEYKTPKTIIKSLVDCVSKGGNLLLNVSPNAYGEIPREAANILEEVGDWMAVNGESIYGCGASDLPRPECGRMTQNGNIYYVHILDEFIGPITVKGLDKKSVKSAALLESGAEVTMLNRWVTLNFPEYQYMSFAPDEFGTVSIPDNRDTVIKIVMRDKDLI